MWVWSWFTYSFPEIRSDWTCVFCPLGCNKPPEQPVCVARKFWGVDDGSPAALSFPKTGVDSNLLHWESLKPFPDAELYIASDCFPASDPSMCYLGFAESSLLTSERILVNYFKLNPVREDICLSNPWPWFIWASRIHIVEPWNKFM